MDLCSWRHTLGEPGKGVHSIRLWDIAIVDLALTFVVAYLLWRWTDKRYDFLVILGACLGLGVWAHRLFCVRTRIDTYLALFAASLTSGFFC